MTHGICRVMTSLSVTAALLGGGIALSAQAASASPATQVRLAASPSLSASLHAAAEAGARAGGLFDGSHRTVSARVRPVLTTGIRTTALTPIPTPAAPPLSETQAYAKEILRQVNIQRAAHGLQALRADACATAYAAAQNKVITAAATLSHQDLGRVLAGCGAYGAGENVAYGNVTADQLMSMWMSSPGHRANILSTAFTHIGIGVAKTSSGRWYGTQVFLTR